MLEVLVSGVVGGSVGAVTTLLANWWLSRNSSSRSARAELYRELLRLLNATQRSQNRAVWDPGYSLPAAATDAEIDAFNARLALDASPAMAAQARICFALIQRFNASHGTGAPIELDAHGFYTYRFDLVRGTTPETAQLNLRVALGRLYDQLVDETQKVAVQARREIHGKRSSKEI